MPENSNFFADTPAPATMTKEPAATPSKGGNFFADKETPAAPAQVKSSPPATAPKPSAKPQDKSYWDRFKEWAGAPAKGQNPEEWAKQQVTAGSEAKQAYIRNLLPGWEAVMLSQSPLGKEAVHGAVFDYSPELDGHIVSALYGPQYGAAYVKAAHEALAKFEKENQALAFAANAAGMMASTLAGGELLGAAAESGRAAPWLTKGLKAAQKVGSLTSKATIPAAAYGAYHGYEKGAEIDQTPSVGAGLEGAAEWGGMASHAGSALAGGALGALQGSGAAGSGHRGEGALEGFAAGALTTGGLGAAGSIARGVDTLSGHKLIEAGWKAEDALRAGVNKMGAKAGMEPLMATKERPFTGPQHAAIKRLIGGQKLEPADKKAITEINAWRAAAGFPPLKAYESPSGTMQTIFRQSSLKSPEAKKLLETEKRRVKMDLPHRDAMLGETISPLHTSQLAGSNAEDVPGLMQLHTQGMMDDADRVHVDRVKAEPHNVLADHIEHVAPGETKTIEQHSEDVEKARNQRADTVYPELYAQRVPLDERVIKVLDSSTMVSSIDRAISHLEEGLDNPAAKQQVKDLKEIKAYLSGVGEGQSWSPDDIDKALGSSEGPQREILRAKIIQAIQGKSPLPPEVSVGSIDRIVRGANSIIKEMPDKYQASLVRDRIAELNKYLDSVPGLEPARADFRAASQHIEASDDVLTRIKNNDARDFGAWAKNLPPEANKGLRIGMKQYLASRSRTPEDALKLAKQISTDLNLRAKIEAIMGKDAQAVFSGAERMTAITDAEGSLAKEAPDEFSKRHANLTEQGKQDMRIAAIDMIREKTSNAKSSASFLQALDQDKDLRANLSTALGHGDAERLFSVARRVQVLDKGGENIVEMSPKDFSRWWDSLGHEDRANMRVVLSDMIHDLNSRHIEDAVGALAATRALEQSPKIQANVRLIVGDQEADRLFFTAGQIQKQWSDIQKVSGSGSTSIPDEENKKLIEGGLRHGLNVGGHAYSALMEMVHNGGVMTPEEATALAKFATGDLEALMTHLEEKPTSMLSHAIRIGMGRVGGGALAGAMNGDDNLPPPPDGPIMPDGSAAPATSNGGSADEPPTIIEPAGGQTP